MNAWERYSMKSPSKKVKSSEARVVSAKIKRKRAPVEVVVEADEVEELDDEEVDDLEGDEDEVEADEDDDGADSESSAYKRKEVKGEAKGFFDTLGDSLRSAGETAKKYTKVGVSYAEIEKLRFDLKSAHASLGEVAMRCWSDAPDLGLTSKDPAVAQAIKRVKEVRRKIREKEAKIAALKSE